MQAYYLIFFYLYEYALFPFSEVYNLVKWDKKV